VEGVISLFEATIYFPIRSLTKCVTKAKEKYVSDTGTRRTGVVEIKKKNGNYNETTEERGK